MRASIGVRFNVGVLLSIPLHAPRGACVPHPKKTTEILVCLWENLFKLAFNVAPSKLKSS